MSSPVMHEIGLQCLNLKCVIPSRLIRAILFFTHKGQLWGFPANLECRVQYSVAGNTFLTVVLQWLLLVIPSLSSCSRAVGEFLVPPCSKLIKPFPLLRYGNRGQGLSVGFPQKLLCVESL